MPIRNVTAYLESAAPYSQSRAHETPKLEKESPDAYEIRAWREKLHYDKDGAVFIPAMAFKQSVDKAIKMLGTQIPGRGKSTYSKHFLAGCILTENIMLRNGKGVILKDAIEGEKIHCNADGVRGSGKRVFRWFPVVHSWNATAMFTLLDDTITKDVFETTLIEAGKYVGVGRFRAENGGMYGRFAVKKFVWN
jgi:hypothetical protein